MKIEVDLDLCQGHAMCELEAPEVFHVPVDRVTLLEPEPGPEHIDAVRRAIRYCPTQALRLSD
jgi:ferredoxin